MQEGQNMQAKPEVILPRSKFILRFALPKIPCLG